MKTINAIQLAFLLGISQRKANKMIAIVRFGNREQAQTEIKLNKNLHCNAELLQKYFLFDINEVLNNVKYRALKSTGMAEYLLQSYPLSKLMVSTPKKTIRLRPALRTLLSRETLNEIEAYWHEKYSLQRFPEWNDSIHYFPVLKP